MTPNKRDLKAYVRFDGTGRIVPGSLVLRRSKPKNGTWKEITAYECCNTPTLNSGEVGGFPWNPADVVLYCNSSNHYIFIDTDTEVANITELVTALNATASSLGVFSVAPDGVSVNLTLSTETAAAFKDCINDLGFEVFND